MMALVSLCCSSSFLLSAMAAMTRRRTRLPRYTRWRRRADEAIHSSALQRVRKAHATQ